MTPTNTISIKSQEEIKALREAGKILAKIVKELKRSLRSGMTTKVVDEVAAQLMVENHVKPAFNGYRGFPGCVCISINEEVVHGIPNERVIKEGDIVSLDVGINFEGFFSDTALTVGIGKIDTKLQKLLSVTEKALYKGIAQARVNNHLSDISHAVQTFVEANHFSVVRDFVGHGIGRSLQEEPEVPNFGEPQQGPVLKESMVLAIEPMVNLGTWKTKIKEDGWTVVTADGLPSAHFEHTIAITKNEPEVLTQ